MKITFVKKILADGSPCGKCADVQERLERNQQLQHIDEVLIADERDPQSAGMRMAAQLGVKRAPFFVVENGDDTTVYTVYFKFVKEVLGSAVSSVEQNVETLRDNPDLDFI